MAIFFSQVTFSVHDERLLQLAFCLEGVAQIVEHFRVCFRDFDSGGEKRLVALPSGVATNYRSRVEHKQKAKKSLP